MLDGNSDERTPDINLRPPLPGSEPGGAGARLDFESFTCEKVVLSSSDGASGLVYNAISSNYYGPKSSVKAKLVIKEAFPLEVRQFLHRQGETLQMDENKTPAAWDAFESHMKDFERAFERHATLHQGQARGYVSVPIRILNANGTVYLASDISNGRTFNEAVSHMTLQEKVRTISGLCEATAAIHEEGFFCLDLKPSNVLAIESAQGKGFTGMVQLFDFDSALRKSDMESGLFKVSGSGSWAAYEQTHPGRIESVGPRSDIYSLGAMLFWIFVGRAPSYVETVHAYNGWDCQAFEGCSNEFDQMGPASKEAFANILSKALTVDVEDRYTTALEMKEDVDNLLSLISPVPSSVENAIEGIQNQVQGTLEGNRRERAKSKRAKGILAAAIAALLAACAFGAFLIGSSQRNQDPIVGTWAINPDSFTVESVDESGYSNWIPSNGNPLKEPGFFKANQDGTATIALDPKAHEITWLYESESNTQMGVTRNYMLYYAQGKVASVIIGTTMDGGEESHNDNFIQGEVTIMIDGQEYAYYMKRIR